MTTAVGGRLRDASLTLGSIGTVVGGMAAIDAQTRRYLSDAMLGQFPSLPSILPLDYLARAISATFPVSASALVALAGSALVLFVLMFRS